MQSKLAHPACATGPCLRCPSAHFNSLPCVSHAVQTREIHPPDLYDLSRRSSTKLSLRTSPL